jgi:hypothetical protein
VHRESYPVQPLAGRVWLDTIYPGKTLSLLSTSASARPPARPPAHPVPPQSLTAHPPTHPTCDTTHPYPPISQLGRNRVSVHRALPTIYGCSPDERIERFRTAVGRAGIKATIRWPRGRDIMAACGQLKTMGDPAAMRDRPAVTTVGAGRLAAKSSHTGR